MLIKCPECELQVSDKALSCPHCGYPMKPEIIKKIRKPSKRRRLPNGFGQISEIKNKNLRKPFRAMVTIGKTKEGKPICKLLKPVSFFETYNDAYEALIEYNKNPYDLSPSITMNELFQKWIDKRCDLSSDPHRERRSFTAIWNYCSSMHNMNVNQIKIRYIKQCIENASKNINGEERIASANIKIQIKNLLNQLLDYAVEYELIETNYARQFKLSSNINKEKEQNRKTHMPYSEKEIKVLWENIYKIEHIDTILIQCYSGWRPQELINLKLNDIDLENKTMTGGMKTDAGKNRIVPIHSCIFPLISKKYNEAKKSENDFLISCKDEWHRSPSSIMTYEKYRRITKKISDLLDFETTHKPHDARSTFVTIAKKAKVDEYAIKYIVGHTINDLTEKIYTKRDVSWLREEIEKIKK